MLVLDEKLLAGAHRAIERYGWQQATLERIATEVGVSRMTLHRRGVTREGLLGALAEPDHDTIFHEAGPRGLTRPAFTEPIRRLLQDGAADGSLVADDPDETATLLLNLVSWTYRHLRRGHGWSARRARDGVLRIALDGV